MSKLKPGDKVYIVGKHPHARRSGTLKNFGPYGPSCFNWQGWLVELDDGEECYAREHEVMEEKRYE